MQHRPGCSFGPGLYRIELISGNRRYCQSEAEVKAAYALLPLDAIRRVARDGYCLDPLELPESPHVLDGEAFLNMPEIDARHALGDISAEEYQRAYRAIEDAVLARDRAVSAGASDRPSIVIKKKGRRVADVAALQVPR
ncbi:MAG TPA: hypothetical protein VFB50_11675 [Chloroflexota bacterium]|nr:hypothetical protein [Chloroflexota bacterium]